MASVIEARDVTRRLAGDVPVSLIQHASLSVHAGEFVAITGPSGSGKSSLLYLLGLLDRPTTGQILLNGGDTSRLNNDQLAATRLAQIGFVFQSHFLLPEFSALENVMLPIQRQAKASKAEAQERARRLLEGLGLSGQINKLPHQMSGGQSQRVAIARALANEPGLILADEPTGNLDTASGAVVQSILKELAKVQSRAVIVVTHEPAFAASADRIITVVDGKIEPD